ncbi:acyl-CoA thioester hydrolase/BAAT C-terminal domain-containing protein [Salinicoccus carnicancri]|uniref:acyl-CoA thioester hydrolase/BAAT C-terminal domain-containing protein n=1 Tax=Salinicoccus carnicancri TaxID=558170 RepID=UPI00036B5FD5|nr:acyl-CoA thioester hydrolase/BAAT C-terminal domain-containing protein [Salinicoccus carnicancri]
MKIVLKVFLGFVVLIVAVAIAVFGMRIYNTQKYDLSGEMPNYHDLSDYPDSFTGGTIEYFESGGAAGFHLLPDTPVATEPIAVFGGSEGSSNFDMALQLAEEGYEVYSLFFFGAPNQNEELSQVPLEFFGDFLKHAELEGEEVTVIGASKGAELGLVLTNYYDEISNLVLYAPSSYVFQGLSFGRESHSSWTWDDEDLPYISLQQSDFWAFARTIFDSIVLNPVKYRETYVSAVETNDNSEAKRIDTSNFGGTALLIAGGDDAMWQSETAAKEIGEALGERAEMDIYPEAGHLFGAPPAVGGLAVGGTIDSNEAAKDESDRRLLQFLEEHVTD